MNPGHHQMKRKLRNAGGALLVLMVLGIVLWRAAEAMLLNPGEGNRLIGIAFFISLASVTLAMTLTTFLRVRTTRTHRDENRV